MRPLVVGFYFNSAHIGAWSWRAFLAGELGLSGTDRWNLSTLYVLSRDTDFHVILFSTEHVETVPPLAAEGDVIHAGSSYHTGAFQE